MDDSITIGDYIIRFDVRGASVYNGTELVCHIDDMEIMNFIYYLAKKCKESMIIQGESHLDSLLRTARENNITLTGDDYWKLVDSLIESGYTVCGKIKKIGEEE